MSGTPTTAFADAITYHRHGRLESAALAYRTVLADPGAPPNEQRAAATNLGRMLLAAGNAADAEALLRQAIALDDTRADLWRDLGGALLASGAAGEAVAALQRATALDKTDPASATNLGIALERVGDRIAADMAVEAALRLAPKQPEALNLKGSLHLAAGDPEGALAWFEAAILARAAYPEAFANRGFALTALHRGATAASSFRQALALRPDFAAAQAGLSEALHLAGDLSGAVAAYLDALALAPDEIAWQIGYGQLCIEAGHLDAAAATFAAVLQGESENPDALAGLLHARQHACDWDGFDDLRAATLTVVAQGVAVPPFVLVAAGAPDALQTRNATAWAAKIAPRRRPAPPLPIRMTGSPIRLGYLSGDFHDHATAHLMAELFEQHDRRIVTVTGYSIGLDDGSPMRRRLVAAFDSFRDLAHHSAEEAAATIRADNIEILVDLKGYTTGARPDIPALRPAPVQVNWLGYPGSMGVEFIDYVLADSIVAPLALQPFCTERIVHLPHCFQPNDAGRPIGPTQPRAAYGLPDSAFVFCCFNNSYKITPVLFAAWIELLVNVPNSVLWLLDGHPTARANLQNRAAAAGLDPARLIFAPRLPQVEHLARHRAADLFLDTLPVNALTTASDALWAGLPVLTCRGDTVAGRGCASLLHAAGLEDLVTETLDEYTAFAGLLAQSPLRLADIKVRCGAPVRKSPLFDTPLFRRNLELAYAQMVAERVG